MGKFQCLLFVLKRSCIYYIICMTVLLNISKNSFEKSKSLFNLLQPATVLKRRLCHRCFSVNFVKNFKKLFLWSTSWEVCLKGDFYEKWWTNILIIIKRLWIQRLFQKTLQKKCMFVWNISEKVSLDLRGRFYVYS